MRVVDEHGNKKERGCAARARTRDERSRRFIVLTLSSTHTDDIHTHTGFDGEGGRREERDDIAEGEPDLRDQAEEPGAGEIPIRVGVQNQRAAGGVRTPGDDDFRYLSRI